MTGPVVAQLQLVFLASFRWLGGDGRRQLDACSPSRGRRGAVPAVVLHNAPGPVPADHRRDRGAARGRSETLDVVNPYVTDRGMIGRIESAARRGVRVRLFVPANANNWACAAAQRFHHATLLDAGVRILEYPTMLHAKAFVRDGEELLAGTCNLEAWSLKRFFEIDLAPLGGGGGAVRRARSSRRPRRPRLRVAAADRPEGARAGAPVLRPVALPLGALDLRRQAQGGERGRSARPRPGSIAT